MGHVPADVRQARAALLEPLAAILRQRGVKRQWFAAQMGVSFSSLWNYINGYDRLPPTFIERASQVLGIPASFFPVPEPRDLYIQQPRTASRSASTAVKSKTTTKKRTATR